LAYKDEVELFSEWMGRSADSERCNIFSIEFLVRLSHDPRVSNSNQKLIVKYLGDAYLGFYWERSRITETKRQLIPGYVYLLSSDIGVFKIGKAIDITKRVKSLGVKIPIQVTLIHSFRSDDYSSAELALHEKFASKRTEGEWFKLDEDDVEYIKSIQDGQL
jgi:hypothetical protein